MIKITRINENEFSYQENENQPITLTKKLDKKTQRYALSLPENELNRKWVQESMIDKNGGEIIIEDYKESHHINQSSKSSKSPKSIKNWEEYLTEEEKSIIKEIREKAEKRYKVEMIKREIEKLQAQLND